MGYFNPENWVIVFDPTSGLPKCWVDTTQNCS